MIGEVAAFLPNEEQLSEVDDGRLFASENNSPPKGFANSWSECELFLYKECFTEFNGCNNEDVLALNALFISKFLPSLNELFEVASRE